MHELRIRAECNLPLGGELDQPKKGFQVALFCSWRNRGGKSRRLGSQFKPSQETLLWSFVSGMRLQRAIHDPRASIFRNPKPGDAALSVSGADVLSCWWGLRGECKFLVCHNGNVWMLPLTNEVLPLFENSEFCVLLFHAVFRGWFSLSQEGV